VAARIRELTEKAAGPLDMSAEEIVQEAARIARARVDQVLTFGPGGVNLLDSEGMSQDVLAAVSEATQTVSAEGDSIRIKLHDKVAALDKLMRRFGAYKDSLDINTPWDQQLG
jgi:phage terminase small subunit